MIHWHFKIFWAARGGGQSHLGIFGTNGVTLTAIWRLSKPTIKWTYMTKAILCFKIGPKPVIKHILGVIWGYH